MTDRMKSRFDFYYKVNAVDIHNKSYNISSFDDTDDRYQIHRYEDFIIYRDLEINYIPIKNLMDEVHDATAIDRFINHIDLDRCGSVQPLIARSSGKCCSDRGRALVRGAVERVRRGEENVLLIINGVQRGNWLDEVEIDPCL